MHVDALVCVARTLLIVFALVSGSAAATQVSGTITGPAPAPAWSVSFTCTLNGTTCSGIVTSTERDPPCSNTVSVTGPFTLSGLDLAAPGALSGTITKPDFNLNFMSRPDGTCTYHPVLRSTSTLPFTGHWNGTTGTITANLGDPSSVATAFFRADVPSQAAVFPMSVTGSITPEVANINAQIQFRPEDVGSTGSVYVFALAPLTGAANASAEKDTPVSCVLAQLNQSGQLQQVSASNMQAYVTGVLSGQGQAVTILDGVPTANIAGATFFVGYGPNATSMINNGINRSAVTVPGGLECRPAPPQTGWWWNPDEGGRGYSIEVSGHHLFIAAYLYDASGRATWTIAAGNTSLDGSLFVGKLEAYAGGQSLFGSYRAPGPVSYLGDVTLAFSDATHGTLSWPGGTIAIERFNIIPQGLATAPLANQPQNGWWWNPQESGRGYFLEWQGNTLFMAGYMYDDAGNPVWYLSSNASQDIQRYANTWWQYANGQTLAGAHKPAQQISNNVAPVTIQFQGAETGIMTLPGNRTINISRYRF